MVLSDERFYSILVRSQILWEGSKLNINFQFTAILFFRYVIHSLALILVISTLIQPEKACPSATQDGHASFPIPERLPQMFWEVNSLSPTHSRMIKSWESQEYLALGTDPYSVSVGVLLCPVVRCGTTSRQRQIFSSTF